MRRHSKPLVNWLDQARPISVMQVAQRLGYQRKGRALGPQCPVCGASKRAGDDRRFPLALVAQGGGWHHFDADCDAKGDALDLVSISLTGSKLRDLDGDGLEIVRAWYASNGWCDARHDGWDDAPKKRERIPLAELESLWRESSRVLPPWSPLDDGTVCHDEEVVAFLRRRGTDPDIVDEHSLARVLPDPKRYSYPQWWPFEKGRTARVYRLAIVAFDACTGHPAAIHARSVVDADEMRARGLNPKQKTRSPRGYPFGGLLFANREAWWLMGAKRPEDMPSDLAELEAVFVCEGLTDWLTLSVEAARGEMCAAVFGAAAGGFRALADVRWMPLEVPVIVAVDHDKTGCKYAEEVRKALPAHNVQRIQPQALTRKEAA